MTLRRAGMPPERSGSAGTIFSGMKWGDLLIVLVVAALSLALWGKILLAGRQTGNTAEIVAGGEVILRYDLETGNQIYVSPQIGTWTDAFSESKDAQGDPLIAISRNGIHFKLLLKDGRIRFLESDCPDRVCVNTGFISAGGQVAACVPAGVLVRITGAADDSDSAPDVIIK